MRENIFFVCGLPRSGTTWLQKSLDSHPEIICLGESNLFGTLIPNIEKELERYHRYLQDVPKWAPKSRPIELMYNREIIKSIFFSLIKSNCQSIPKKVHIFGEKTPDNLLNYEIIIRNFPDCKLIHIVRDPRDGAISAYYRFKKNIQYKNVNDYAKKYVGAWTERIISARKNIPAKNYIEIRYEDLYDQYEETMKYLVENLGASSDENTIIEIKNKNTFFAYSDRHIGDEVRESHYRKGLKFGWKHEGDLTRESWSNPVSINLIKSFNYEID